MVWSGRATLYHGTSADYGAAISARIDPTLGRIDTDFGLGFYATTSRTQAVDWAVRRSRSRRNSARRRGLDARQIAPSLVTMELNWNNMTGLRVLAFVLNTHESRFFEFVAMCRAQYEETRHWPMNQNCDLIIGPVAQSWGGFTETKVLDGFDQYCFHTEQAVSALTVTGVEPC